jgi:hypothetical protein
MHTRTLLRWLDRRLARRLLGILAGLVGGLLAIVPCAAGQSAAGPSTAARLPAHQSRQANVPMLFTTEVVSELPHHSLASARRDALQRAQQAVTAFLREQNPPIYYVPSLEFIEQLVKSIHHEQHDLRDDPSIGCIMYRERLRVQLTEADLYRIARLDREDRSQQRMLLLARVVAALIVLTGTLSLYIWLDDWLRGFMTGWLRLLALVLAASGLAVIVLLR